jgi:phosphoribosylamine--glycine ligase
MKSRMKVLVLGGGGREHAIIWALSRTSTSPLDLYCAPGNGGISELARCVPIAAADSSQLVQFALSAGIDMTIVGPEAPLASGIVDDFERQGLSIIGPNRAASRLEASKALAKDFMARQRIPTARYRVANSHQEALTFLHSGEFGSSESPVVVKADGLAAGKGVIMASSRVDAERAVQELMTGDLVGPDAARKIVLEEVLEGIEASVLLFADGRDYALMPPARDHKRLGENDTGPNTGGMGAITDESLVEEQMLKRVIREVLEPTLEGARAEGFPFRGILFVGLMLTNDGPKVLEYNVRFGDPETQAILVRLETDLLEIFQAVRTGQLREMKVQWRKGASACVVLASGGYPGNYETGSRIAGLSRLERDKNVEVFHGGTLKSERGDFVTAGGRVLGVTATGNTLAETLSRCYGAAEKISWAGIYYRRDIGRFQKPQPKGRHAV